MNNTPVPQNLPEELLPLYDWWKTKGPKTVATLALGAIVGLAVYSAINWHKGRLAQASEQITVAQGIDEIEAANERFGSTGAGNLLQIRLARAYYDAGRFEDALAAYNAFVKENGSHSFVPLAQLGAAATQEAMADYATAQASYTQLLESGPTYLRAEAKLGLIRALYLAGEKVKANEQLDAFLADNANEAWHGIAENLKETLKSYKPRARMSLMDMANAVAPLPEKATAPAAPAQATSATTNPPAPAQ